MPWNRLQRSWTVTRSHLLSAAKRLPSQPIVGEDSGTLERYQEWLDHNELELALDDLADVGLSNRVSKDFWCELLAAAKNMGLDSHCTEYERLIQASKMRSTE